jgi:hypothetical protein
VFHVADRKLSDPRYAAAIDATFKEFEASPYVASVRNHC